MIWPEIEGIEKAIHAAPRLPRGPLVTSTGRWVTIETNDHEPRRTVWVPETPAHSGDTMK